MFKKLLAISSAGAAFALSTLSVNAWFPFGFGFGGFPFGFGFGGFPFGFGFGGFPFGFSSFSSSFAFSSMFSSMFSGFSPFLF